MPAMMGVVPTGMFQPERRRVEPAHLRYALSAGEFVVPAGWDGLTADLEVYGTGGGGNNVNPASNGGGGAGYAKKTRALVGGETLTIDAGSASQPTKVDGLFAYPGADWMSASGGTATGGDVNLTGSPGVNGGVGGRGAGPLGHVYGFGGGHLTPAGPSAVLLTLRVPGGATINMD